MSDPAPSSLPLSHQLSSSRMSPPIYPYLSSLVLPSSLPRASLSDDIPSSPPFSQQCSCTIRRLGSDFSCPLFQSNVHGRRAILPRPRATLPRQRASPPRHRASLSRLIPLRRPRAGLSLSMGAMEGSRCRWLQSRSGGSARPPATVNTWIPNTSCRGADLKPDIGSSTKCLHFCNALICGQT